MPILLSSFLLLFAPPLWACQIKKDKIIYSLSGPVTMMLSELNLLKDPALKGVSIFHAISEEFKGEILPGGIFLGHETLKKFQGADVFYDDAQDLTRMFNSNSKISSVKLQTRGLTPLEVTHLVRAKLSPYLENCSQQLDQIQASHQQALQQLKKLASHRKLLFFIGPFKSKAPELLIINDGVVKWLIDEKVIKTYPSELAYVSWSPRVMSTLSSDYVKVGLVDSGREKKQKLERVDGALNVTYPGLLVPGIGQVKGLIFLFSSI